MDTTTPPPPSGHAARSRQGPLRHRLLAADVIDLLLVAGVGTAVGLATYLAREVDDPTGFENLGAFFFAAILATVVGGILAVALLVATARGGSLGDRVAGRDHDGGAAAAGWRVLRVVALVAALGAASGVPGLASARGWDGVVLPLLSGAFGAGIATVAYVDRRDGRWARWVAVAVAVGAVLGMAVGVSTPSRPLSQGEVRDRLAAQAPQVLEQLGATRVCRARGVPDVPTASHTTEPCYDPDEVWRARGQPSTVAADLAARLQELSPEPVDVAVTESVTATGRDAWELRLSYATLVHVAATDCGTRVRVTQYGNHPLRDDRFVPDVELGERCV